MTHAHSHSYDNGVTSRYKVPKAKVFNNVRRTTVLQKILKEASKVSSLFTLAFPTV